MPNHNSGTAFLQYGQIRAPRAISSKQLPQNLIESSLASGGDWGPILQSNRPTACGFAPGDWVAGLAARCWRPTGPFQDVGGGGCPGHEDIVFGIGGALPRVGQLAIEEPVSIDGVGRFDVVE